MDGMQVGELCNREVTAVERGTSVREAAALMRQHHVGDLVVTEQRGARRAPVGIITDRDITIEIVAMGVDPESVSVTDVMGAQLVTAGEGETVYDVIRRMRLNGVRRVPVLDAQGGLAGIVSLVDLLQFPADEIGTVAKVAYREQVWETRTRK
jgi:CBS domain-containing protein